VPKRPSDRRAAILAVLIALLAALSGSLSGAQDGPLTPPTSLDVMRVYYADRAQKTKLLISFKAQLLETVAHESYHVMQLTPEEIGRLTSLGFHVQPDPDWRPRPAPDHLDLAPQTSGIPGYPCYRTVEETFAQARKLALDHPRLATWQDIGDSWQKTAGQGGYDMMALRLTNSQVPGPKPVLILNAAIHGREYATAELVMRFVESLVAGYGIDADATWILDHHEVHAVLFANPDGRKQAEAGLLWRKNTNQAYCGPASDLRGADLNRNFDFQWACCDGSSASECAWDYHGPAAASEPETQALQNYWSTVFVDQRASNLSAPAPDGASGILLDVHSYGELVLWPWGFFQDCDTFESTIVPDNLPALRYAAKVARVPYMTPAGPEGLQLSLSDQASAASTLFTLQATLDNTRSYAPDSSEPAQTVIAAEWYVDTPPWQSGSQARAMAAADGEWDSSIEEVESAIDTSDWSPGVHTVFVRGQDADGHWGATSAIFVSVKGSTNHVPVAAFDVECQGLACWLDAARSFDRDGNIVAYDWSLGDDSSASGLTASHEYPAPGIYVVTLTVAGDNGVTGSQTQHIAVGTHERLYLPYIHAHIAER
jgi:carboxypeptidase T